MIFQYRIPTRYSNYPDNYRTNNLIESRCMTHNQKLTTNNIIILILLLGSQMSLATYPQNKLHWDMPFPGLAIPIA